jgi:hypothetical protein
VMQLIVGHDFLKRCAGHFNKGHVAASLVLRYIAGRPPF